MPHLVTREKQPPRPPCAPQADPQPLRLGRMLVRQGVGGADMPELPGGAFQILLQEAGEGRIVRGGRGVAVGPEHWHAFDPAAWSAAGGEDGEQILIALPQSALSPRIAGLLRAGPGAAYPLDGVTRMILDVARSCLAQADHLDAMVAASLGESLLELVRLALANRLGGRPSAPVRETVRGRIEAFVQRNLFDHELSIDMIAARMRCTKRYLHKVFSGGPQTLSQFIWEQRLERCRADLERPELADRSITEIAFAWGFSNAAHFSRSFRSRYGVSPRAHRLAHAR